MRDLDKEILAHTPEMFDKALGWLVDRHLLFQTRVREGYVFGGSAFEAELAIAGHLSTLRSSWVFFEPPPLEELNEELNEEQVAAVVQSFQHPVSIVTGPPGSGKGTVCEEIANHAHVVWLAPTGAAARRLSTRIEEPVHTVHKLLYMNDESVLRALNQGSPPPTWKKPTHVIVDEASMLDVELLARLLVRLLRLECPLGLVLVGDADQLPPVQPGLPFRDLIDVVPTVRLTHVYRYGGAVGQFVRGVRNEKIVGGGEGEACRIIESTSIDDLMYYMTEALPAMHWLPDDIQVLCTQRRTCDEVNTALQRVYTGGQTPLFGACKIGAKQIATLGDRVIHTKNNYDLDVMNGEIGYVVELDRKGKWLRVEYADGRVVSYDSWDTREQLQLAYALTVHRSQGGEFKCVVFYLPDKDWTNKDLVYTAGSRAKEFLLVLAKKYKLQRGVKTKMERRTLLRDFLDEEEMT